MRALRTLGLAVGFVASMALMASGSKAAITVTPLGDQLLQIPSNGPLDPDSVRSEVEVGAGETGQAVVTFTVQNLIGTLFNLGGTLGLAGGGDPTGNAITINSVAVSTSPGAVGPAPVVTLSTPLTIPGGSSFNPSFGILFSGLTGTVYNVALDLNVTAGSGGAIFTTNVFATPLPAAVYAFGAGLLALGGLARRRRRTAATAG